MLVQIPSGAVMDAILEQLCVLEEARDKLHLALRKAEFALSVARRVEEGRGVLLSVDAVPTAPNSIYPFVHLFSSPQVCVGHTLTGQQIATRESCGTTRENNDDDNCCGDAHSISHTQSCDKGTGDALRSESTIYTSSLANTRNECDCDDEQAREEVSEEYAVNVGRWELCIVECVSKPFLSRRCTLSVAQDNDTVDTVAAAHTNSTSTTHHRSLSCTPLSDEQAHQLSNESNRHGSPCSSSTADECALSCRHHLDTHCKIDDNRCCCCSSASVSAAHAPELMFSAMPSLELRECQAYYRATLDDILATVKAQVELMEIMRCYDGLDT